MTVEEANNLILKTMARVQVNSLIFKIENLTSEQLKNKTILEALKDSIDSIFGCCELKNSLLSIVSNETHEKLIEMRERLQIKILSLELEEISSHNPPVVVKKDI